MNEQSDTGPRISINRAASESGLSRQILMRCLTYSEIAAWLGHDGQTLPAAAVPVLRALAGKAKGTDPRWKPKGLAAEIRKRTGGPVRAELMGEAIFGDTVQDDTEQLSDKQETPDLPATIPATGDTELQKTGPDNTTGQPATAEAIHLLERIAAALEKATPPDKLLLTLGEAAALSGLSKATVKGKVPSVKDGPFRRWRRVDVVRFMEEMG